MRKVIVGIFAAIGVFAVLTFLLVGCVSVVSLLTHKPLPSRIVLEIDFERGVVESIPDDFTAAVMFEGAPQVIDLVDAIDRAAEDRRVKALIARVGGGGMGLAHIQEIRDAILRFRLSGKPAIAFSETFGEFGPGNGGYYLATAFDRIHLQPSGDVGLTGLMYESMFVRGLLEKLDVEPRLDQRHEYKNAMNFYTDRAFTGPHRQSMQELVDSQFDQLVRGIAEARGMSEAEVAGLFDSGPFLGHEALDAGLVDSLAYRDEVYDAVLEEAGSRASLVSPSAYLEDAGSVNRSGSTIALIQGHGTVARGKSSYSPINGSVTMGSDSVTEAFRAAIDDKRVQAIVFRVDSPGGSYVASDTIRRETIRAREADKPVIVSMGNLAGSGGYFVAMDAHRIVAQPGTITASIGVLGGKLLTRGFWGKLGISWDDVHTSDHSTMWSPRFDYEDGSWDRFQAGLDRIYEDFTERVAAGRGLPLDEVQRIAKGRIWTGEQALDLGLVDALGGVDTAISLAKEAAGLDEGDSVRIRRFPRPKSQLELLMSLTEVGQGNPAAASLRLVAAIQPTMRWLQRLGLFEDPGVLALPDLSSTP